MYADQMITILGAMTATEKTTVLKKAAILSRARSSWGALNARVECWGSCYWYYTLGS